MNALHPGNASGCNLVREWTAAAILVLAMCLLAANSGAEWGFGTPILVDAGDHNSFPDVAGDGHGHWILVWEHSYDVMFSRSLDDGATWSAPSLLCDTWLDWGPGVAVDGKGTWIIVWYSEESFGDTIGDDSDILVSRSTDYGTTWSDPAPLNTTAATDVSTGRPETSMSDYFPKLATDCKGNWVCVWVTRFPLDEDGDELAYDFHAARSGDNGATWSDPVLVNEREFIDNSVLRGGFHIVTDEKGTWVTVWPEGEGQPDGPLGIDLDILVARSTDNGATWSEPAPLNTDAATDDYADFDCRLATDGDGNWICIWSVTIGWFGGGYHPEWEQRDVCVARSSDNGLTWTDPVIIATSSPETDPAPVVHWYPRITTDRAGTWLATWQWSSLRIEGRRSGDRGATWSPIKVLTPAPASERLVELHPDLATDGDGTWIAAYSPDGDQIAVSVAPYNLDLPEDDSDGDGIINSDEGTDDPDNDRVPNFLDTDSDDDGLDDGEEVHAYLTDPLDPDSDDDGMPDGWEVDNWLNPLADDSSEDADADGLTNLDEFGAGTDPQVADTDGDGLDDGEEINTYLTDPLEPDTDDDGCTDGVEVAQGTDPNDPASFPISRGGSGGPCFIATAAYGTPLAEEVAALRDFRDRFLLTSRAGTAVVKAYYRFSPPLARFMATRAPLRAAVRFAVTPIPALAGLAVHEPPLAGTTTFIAFTSLSLCGWRLVRKRSARSHV